MMRQEAVLNPTDMYNQVLGLLQKEIGDLKGLSLLLLAGNKKSCQLLFDVCNSY